MTQDDVGLAPAAVARLATEATMLAEREQERTEFLLRIYAEAATSATN